MSFDAHKNLVVTKVATAPSPATSGTTLIVDAGDGAHLPAVPFNVTISPNPTGLAPDAIADASEIARVTARSTDTLTIVRAQEGTSARTVVVGDFVSVTLTAKTITDIEAIASLDGWIAAGETWTYASADAPTFTFTVAADVTAKYSPGMRIKLTQTTDKYFIITAVSTFSGGNTTITVYGGTDYTLANATITSPFWSMLKAPFGFPLNPTKWTVLVTDTTARTQSTPVTGTWYNPGSISISIPIGVWDVSYNVALLVSAAAGNINMFATLSTANNSESDSDLTVIQAGQTWAFGFIPAFREKTLAIAAKTSYFLNTKTGATSMSSIGFSNDNQKAIIQAVCAYL